MIDNFIFCDFEHTSFNCKEIIDLDCLCSFSWRNFDDR